jgi:hypothetical protein
MTARAMAEERRKWKDTVADTALTIAETSVPEAMQYVRVTAPHEFMQRSEKYVKTTGHLLLSSLFTY